METAEKTHVEDEKGKLDLKKGAKRGDKIDQKKDQHRNNENKWRKDYAVSMRLLTSAQKQMVGNC